MDTFTSVVGWLVCTLLVLIAFLLSVYCVLYILDRILCKCKDYAVEVAVRDIGSQIREQSYWFSEDPDAADIVYAVGDQVLKCGRFDASIIRDEWREKKAKRNKPDAD